MGAAPLSIDVADTRSMLEAAAAIHGDTEAYVEPGARITFADWVGRARSVATQFADLGVGKGDVVALWLPSGIDYATCYAAAAMIGAITTGLNPRLGRREVESILQQADPALIVADDRLGLLPDLGRRILSRTALATDVSGSRVPTVDLTRRDLVAVIFTSGTTGTPKGAVFDADRLAAGAAAAGVMSAPYDRRLTSTPFAHAGYMFKLWDQLVWGSTLVVPPTPWSAQGMFDILRAERITVAGAVPTQWAKLLEVDGVSPSALPDLRIGIAATAPASPELVRRVADRVGVPLVVRYAMTECPTICGTDPNDSPEVQFRTVGRPATGMDVRIAPDGVVEVHGPCVMRGYWRNPEVTAEVLRDGWLRTGDVGTLDGDGNLTLVGRSGDMYIRGGYNIHPGEVERTLAGHPGVKQAAVIGRSAPVIGEIGVACVVPADRTAPPTLADLRAHVTSELADYKAPDELLIVDELPLTAMLKPDRIALRELITMRHDEIQRRQPTR
ncbi:class I adenylate-forming enzyme family protein [Mycobacterium avium]|uniref:Acyl-CoA synthase n=1 Tax=Mycobacterium avium (strain 104) TaxID=243243 RepID=A0A0H3A3P6_MYCA1|nr:class I adenylate-forming enzyme family protein [Mycobacterium avium]EUA38136.1 AMP-binding enzyme family protein [Mycobacterium avium subsp. avium 2285 (R)]ABK69164.1 acyl-CoA synthase [Mycobacterium avium 104]KDP07066.1 acyl-CoA synthetase [Mycobacterium avium subsp. hominissuis 101]MCA2295274.1 acyl--CoA ligase [Mycobacterium avium]MCG3244915.1 acyl--CoA ligase [Mycobacterium avium subsp. hominissuis]